MKREMDIISEAFTSQRLKKYIRLYDGDEAKVVAHYKAVLKPLFGTTYKHELLNNLFFHPYTKIEFVCNDMGVQRKTGAKYLDMIVGAGLLNKIKIGRENYYINKRLFELFLNHSEAVNIEDVDIIRTE